MGDAGTPDIVVHAATVKRMGRRNQAIPETEPGNP